jgi:hypothetical protein
MDYVAAIARDCLSAGQTGINHTTIDLGNAQFVLYVSFANEE